MNPLSSTTRRLREDASADIGHILILTAVMMFGLLIMAAFSVDVGQWYDTANRSQRAADNASLAAVKELVVTEQATGSRATAEAAAQTAAEEVARQNGFDVADSGISVATTFRQVGGSEVAEVDIADADVPMFFAGIVLSDMQISRDAEAIMAGCDSVCGGDIEIPPPLGVFIDTDAGGDGYQAERVGDYFFNLFHHQSGDILMCTDVTINAPCAPGGDTSIYPAEPYQNVRTNYTPKVEPFGDKVFWISQGDVKTRLGCWDSTTHTRCTGFGNGFESAPYKPNGSGNQNSRINGPDLVNGRLYMYGDDNRMYCYDPTLDVACAGYPKNTSLYGVHDMQLNKASEGIAGGVKTNGMQFDTAVHPDGRIWHSIGPTNGDGVTWIGCWDTNTAAPCAGWTNAGTNNYLGFLFFTYDTNNNINGICARAGKEGGDKPHECFNMSGADAASALPWNFKDFGEQSASAMTSAGHQVTYFPAIGDSRAECWDWTSQSVCSTAPSNWDSTAEYAYTWDGGIGGCIIGLGHKGRVWSFRVDDGQAPCEGNSTGQGLISACTCVDSGIQQWTALSLSPDSDLADFASFLVSIRRPDGSLYLTVDLVQQGSSLIDLSPLNDESPVPTTLNITATAVTVDGSSDTAWFGTDGPVLIQTGGTKPTLLS